MAKKKQRGDCRRDIIWQVEGEIEGQIEVQIGES